MPHLWNNILAVTYAELVPEWFSTHNYLRKKVSVAKKRGYGITKIRRGGGGYEALIKYDSLSPEIKEALGDPRKSGHILEEFYNTDAEAVTFYRDYKFLEDGTYLDDEIQAKYITNASVLNAVKLLKFARETERMNKGFSHRGVFKSLTEDVESFNEVLKTKYGIEHDLPANQIRFKQKYNLYHEKGYLSLITKYHKNKNRLKVTDKVEKFLNILFAGDDDKPSPTEVARRYETFIGGYLKVESKKTGELFEPKDYPKLSNTTVTNFLRTWNSQVGTFTKRNQGNRQVLMQKFSTPHKLTDPFFAGEILSIDDRQPPFMYAKGERAWFYKGIDLGANCFTVWVHAKTKKALIIEFYRQLVRNYHAWGFNIPVELECETSLNSSFRNTMLSNGNMFNKVRMEANKARAKKVERKFGKFRNAEEFEKGCKGWIPRPFALSEPNQAGQVETDKIPLIPYNEIVAQTERLIEKWNNELHPNQGLHPNMTCWEVFVNKQSANVTPTNYRGILPFIGEKTKTSCNAGIIKLNGSVFLLGDKGNIYKGTPLIQLMQQAEGRELDIYWLAGDDGIMIKALVYLRGETQYICEALPQPAYPRGQNRTPEEEAKRTIMSAYSNTINGYMKTQKNEIERAYVTDNTPAHKPAIVFKIRKDADTNTEFEQNTSFDTENKEKAEELELIEQESAYVEDLATDFDTF